MGESDPSSEALKFYLKAEKELKGILKKPKIYTFDSNYRSIGKYKPTKLKKSNLCPFNSQTRHVANPIASDKAFIKSGGQDQIQNRPEDSYQKIYRPIPIKPVAP
jgi:hypothetical protein